MVHCLVVFHAVSESLHGVRGKSTLYIDKLDEFLLCRWLFESTAPGRVLEFERQENK